MISKEKLLAMIAERGAELPDAIAEILVEIEDEATPETVNVEELTARIVAEERAKHSARLREILYGADGATPDNTPAESDGESTETPEQETTVEDIYRFWREE